MRLLLLLAAGLFIANRLEIKMRGKREKKMQDERTERLQTSMDEALEESFPASDPPSYSSPTQYHH